jgi:hypothetical protein
MNPEKPYPVLVIAAFVCFAIVLMLWVSLKPCVSIGPEFGTGGMARVPSSRPPALLADVLARLRRGLRRRRQHHRIFENDDLVRAFGIDNLEAG